MQAIQTKYLPATNTKPARIKAWCQGGSVIVSRWALIEPDSMGIEPLHAQVAQQLATKLNWPGAMVCGCLPNGDYAFVFVGGNDHE